MKTNKHIIPQEDRELFESMKGKYLTPNEENFFKNMQYKEENEITGLNDLIVSEYENPDEVYIVREYYEEYVVGRGIGTNGANEEHVMTLTEALAVNLKELGLKDNDMTLFEWLRKCDYCFVMYNRNYDLNR